MSSLRSPRPTSSKRTPPALRGFAVGLVVVGALLPACGALVGIEPIEYQSPNVAVPDSETYDAAAADSSRTEGDSDAASIFACDASTLCDSFERGDPKGEWASISVRGDAVLQCTALRARSGASSLRSTLGTTQSSAYVLSIFGPARRFSVAFSFFVDAAPSRDVSLGLIHFDSSRVSSFVPRLVGGSLVFELTLLGDGGVTTVPVDSLPLVPGKWTDVAVAFELEGSPQRVSVMVDQTTRVSGFGVPSRVDASSVSVWAGAGAPTVGAPFIVDIDDVRIDVEP